MTEIWVGNVKRAASRAVFVLGIAVVLVAGTATTPTTAKEWKTVRIGTDATYPPFESIDPTGRIVGWEIDYGNALCARMQVICTFQNQDWDGIIPSLLAGKFDVILSGMSITPKRQEEVLFSDLYYAAPPVFVGSAADKSNDVSPAALKGKAIGAQSSTIFADYLAKYYKDSDIKLYPAGDEPNIELADGRLDYVVNDSVAEESFIENSGKGCCRIVAMIRRDPAIFGPGVGAAFRKEDTDLCAMFNQAIAALFADGTYDRLAKRYFKVDVRPAAGQ
jgi:polar amino acid transport system substrate-binding protein